MYPKTLAITLGVLCLLSSVATARLLENWPYERLFKESDLVVIATAQATEKAKDSFLDERWVLPIEGLNTTFKIKCVLKGKAKQTLKVLHYKFGEPKKGTKVPEAIIDGPLFEEFLIKATRRPNGQTVVPPDYLLFLKQQKDGRYEPVSGKIDPHLSVGEVRGPGFNTRRIEQARNSKGS